MPFLKFTAIAILVVATITSAQAAPFIAVRATWFVGLDEFMPPPDGIVLSCSGDAVGGSAGCGAELILSQIVTTSGTYVAGSLGNVVITNTSGHVIDGYLGLSSSFSAFNPGGSNVGLGIDDPFTQGARFTSAVGGLGVGDYHGCSIGTFGEGGSVFSSTTCGVSSPDASQMSFSVDLSALAPNGQIILPYGINIEGAFAGDTQAVPEPASALLLLAGLAVLGVRRKNLRA